MSSQTLSCGDSIRRSSGIADAQRDTSCQTDIVCVFIYLLVRIIKSRQTREIKYNTKRIAEVQKNKNILTDKQTNELNAQTNEP